MAVASAQQKSPQSRKQLQTAQQLRTRQELLDWALKQPTPPSRDMLAEFNQRFGDDTSLWLMEQLTQVHQAPAPDTGPSLRAMPDAEPHPPTAKSEEGKESKEDKKGEWHVPEHHLAAAKKEGFDNKAMATHGWARMQTHASDTQATEVIRRGKPTEGPQLKTRDKKLKADTQAHVVDSFERSEAGGVRTTTKAKTTTTRGDAAVIQKIDVAAEEAEKARKERESKGLGNKLAQHDFRVAATEKEWGKHEEEDGGHKLLSGVAGTVSGVVGGPAVTAKLGAEAAASVANGVTVAGNVAVKAVAFEGGLKYVSPTIPVTVLGEKLRAIVEVAFKAEALAEAKGGVKLNILARSDGLDVDIGGGRGLGASGSVEAFAGLRAGVNAALKVDWQKRADYFASRRDQLLHFFQHTVGLPEGRIASYVLEKASRILFGSPGWVNLLKAAAGLEASAGAGGAAAFDMAVGGGRLKFSSKLKGSFGLGFGGTASLDASILEGLRFLAVLVANGGAAIAEDLGLSKDRIVGQAKEKLLAQL